jgi:heme exporter protein A
MNSPRLLQVDDLSCVRGGRQLFSQLGFALDPSQGLHVAGENGAGKTSLLRVLAGLLEPESGTVAWRGRDIRRGREELHTELAFVGHLNGIKDDLTVLENIRLAAAVRGVALEVDAMIHALDQVGMVDYAGTLARQLSQGQRRRVALTRLFAGPMLTLWILDEPFNALDARSTQRLHDAIDHHLAAGGAVVLTAHQDIPMPAAVRTMHLGRSGVSS